MSIDHTRTIDLTQEFSRNERRPKPRYGSFEGRLLGCALSRSGELIDPEALTGAPQRGMLMIKGVLGRGALGEIYEVHPLQWPLLRFALKVPRPPLDHAIPPLLNEREKLRQVPPTHVPRVLMTGEMNIDGAEVPFYVTDILQPIDDVFPRFEREGRLGVLATLRIIYALARTLLELARANIVHNDFKLDNLMFLDPFPVLVDFGTAKFSGEINEIEAARKAGRLHGTPKWLPPEVVSVEKGADGLERVLLRLEGISQFTDVYGLGLLLMLLLTGTEVFAGIDLGRNPVEVFRNMHHQFGRLDRLGNYRRQCAKFLERHYLTIDPLVTLPLTDEDMQRLYAASEARDQMEASTFDAAPEVELGLLRRLTRKLAGGMSARESEKVKGAGIEGREKLIGEVLELWDWCTGPLDQNMATRRKGAAGIVDFMDRTWPGLADWYRGVSMPYMEFKL